MIRGANLNSEVALRIDSLALGHPLTALFDDATSLDSAFRPVLDEPGNEVASLRWDAVERGPPVSYAREPLAGAWRLWVTRLFWALAAESML